MENKALLHSLSTAMGRDIKDVTALLDTLGAVMKERLSDMDTIAIPGFGEFEPVKEDEHIDTDPTTGERMLIPPSISVKFKPSSLLKRKIKESR
ncbi:MAG: HU family DNA-binding protein [Muribaculum sp.]|nr:HU family DNA-binding protein [Muribaculum sp.]